MDKMEELLISMPVKVRQAVRKRNLEFDRIREIRLRNGRNLMIVYEQREILCKEAVIEQQDFNQLMEFATRHSVYAYENELRQGYITIRGGHRIGFCGKGIVKNGQVGGFKYISSANVRVAHQVRNCARQLLSYIGGRNIESMLIISPPGCGKTTLLRELIRHYAGDEEKSGGMNVGVCDERGEIAAMYEGKCGNDLGLRSDVVDGCDKETAMEILIRGMAPDVIAVDEIGRGDIDGLFRLCNAGCRILATIHGSGLESVVIRPELENVVKNGLFKLVVVLSGKCGVGTIEKIYSMGEESDEADDACGIGYKLLFNRT